MPKSGKNTSTTFSKLFDVQDHKLQRSGSWSFRKGVLRTIIFWCLVQGSFLIGGSLELGIGSWGLVITATYGPERKFAKSNLGTG